MGRALAGGERKQRRFLMSSTNSIILSAAEEGLRSLEGFSRGTKDRGEGFFQEPEFILRTWPLFHLFPLQSFHQILKTGPWKHFTFCEMTLLFNISDGCPAGPSGVTICPFLLLCKCAHPALAVWERIRDERWPSSPNSSLTGVLKYWKPPNDRLQSSPDYEPCRAVFSPAVTGLFAGCIALPTEASPASAAMPSIVFICISELSDF